MPTPFLLVPALVASLAIPAFAGDRGPSTPEERQRVLSIAADSDKDPLKVMATEGRWFKKWLDEVPDLTFGGGEPAVQWVSSVAKGDLRRVAPFKFEVGGVAYMIQHGFTDPRKTPDKGLAIYTASLEGLVRAYAALRDLRPENKSEKLDEALDKLNKGEFPAFVKGLFGARK